MRKQVIAALLAICLCAGMLAGCGGSTSTASGNAPAAAAPAEGAEGKVINIYSWNDEFRQRVEAIYDQVDHTSGDATVTYLKDGCEIHWIVNPNQDGVYQQKLDEALLNQENAADDDKVDMFLAEADYILKYAGSPYTQDIQALGVTDFSNTYPYTVQAASDAEGVVKGVSFQCCPSALIYRRSIAKDVLGTDEPAEVQELLNSWEKFNAVAADAAAKGYLMTSSFAETYRVFSNNTTSPWVNENNELQFDDAIVAWMDQTEMFIENGYTLTSGIWDDETTAHMFADGKTMCFFGPAWYFNFCMGNAQDPDKGCFGDWAICEGPQAHFWGGTWLLAPAGTDNPTMLADVMDTFINDEEVCSKLIENEAQFTNNQAVNAKYAEDPSFGNAFLGGQNDVALFVELAKNIKFENNTIYDQLLNEGLQNQMQEHYRGSVDKDTALKNFYNYVNETYPAIVTP